MLSHPPFPRSTPVSGLTNGTNTCKDDCCGSNETDIYCLYNLSEGAQLEDMTNAATSWNRLRGLISNWKKTKQPFFVGQGFHRPHLPVRAHTLPSLPAAVLRASPSLLLRTRMPAAALIARAPTSTPLLQWDIPKEFYDKTASMVPPPKHTVWPSDHPHLHFHDCAEMSHAYFDDKGFGVPLDQGGDYWS